MLNISIRIVLTVVVRNSILSNIVNIAVSDVLLLSHLDDGRSLFSNIVTNETVFEGCRNSTLDESPSVLSLLFNQRFWYEDVSISILKPALYPAHSSDSHPALSLISDGSRRGKKALAYTLPAPDVCSLF